MGSVTVSPPLPLSSPPAGPSPFPRTHWLLVTHGVFGHCDLLHCKWKGKEIEAGFKVSLSHALFYKAAILSHSENFSPQVEVFLHGSNDFLFSLHQSCPCLHAPPIPPPRHRAYFSPQGILLPSEPLSLSSALIHAEASYFPATKLFS